MLMGRLFENHLYYVGHLLELACFGLRFGFTLNSLQVKAATGCLNICNELIARYASGLARAEVLLPFSHYRRGLTMWQSAIGKTGDGLEAFTADFDETDELAPSDGPALSAAFNFAVDAERPSERLQDVLDTFVMKHPDLPRPKGSIRHFRRLIPEGWDRRLHYEFLDYGDRIGVELHFESSRLVELLPAVRATVAELSIELGTGEIVEKTYPDAGAAKLALAFDGDTSPERLADAMNSLICATREELGRRMIRCG